MRIPAVAALVVALGLTVARAEMLPGADAYFDASRVALIVEARIVEGDRVKVTRTLYAAKPLPEGTTELRVEGLSKLDRRLDPFSETSKSLVAADVVLLLEPSDDAWKPHNLFDFGESSAAAGAFFVRDGKVWCYVQLLNPGPLVLVSWPPHAKSQGTIEDLRAEISAGLAAKKAWDEDLATKDPAERAKRLMRWLRGETSPDGKGRVHIRAYAVREETRKIGAAAVPALVAELARTDDAETGGIALTALADIGPAAKDAVPRLVEVAATPGKLSLQYIAWALAEIADPRANPTFRRLLADTRWDDREMIKVVCRGLRACKDPDAEKLIAEKLSPK